MSASTTFSRSAEAPADSFFAKLAAHQLAPFLILTALCALLYLPGLSSIPPTDRDESRFMQATKQMIETGDYVHIHFQDEPRNKKPAGIHWLQSAAVKLAGQDLLTYWPYRMPSVFAAWFAVLACFVFVSRVLDRRTALLAAGVLATSFMVVIEAHIAKTDAALLAATTTALGALVVIYIRRQACAPVIPFVLWVSLAAGALVKGPVSLTVALVTILAVGIADRGAAWLKHTRPLIGVPLLLALTLPWFLASSGGGGSDGGNNFIVEAIRGDLIPKLIGGQESHGAPPGSHLAAGLITFWPWSLVAPFAVLLGWRRKGDPLVRFSLAWLGATWLMFELVPTKLPHYTLPAFPPLALLVAAALQTGSLPRLMKSTAGRVYRAVWAAVTLALGAGIVFAARQYGGDIVMAGLAACVLAAGAGLAAFSWEKTAPALYAMAAAVLFALVLSAGVIPRLNDLAVSPRLAAAIAPHRASSAGPVAMAGYSEPSAVYLLGTDTLLTTTASVTDYLLSHPGAIGVIESEHLPAVSRSVSEAGKELRRLSEVVGYNYSRGDPVALSVVTVIPAPAQP